jgi:hypothetical protein
MGQLHAIHPRGHPARGDEERSVAASAIWSEIEHNIEFAERQLEEFICGDEFPQARIDAARIGLGRAVKLVDALQLIGPPTPPDPSAGDPEH